MSVTMTGGCACGAVRYRLESEPFDAGWCHCRICQLVSGAPAMAFASVPSGDYRLTQGEAKVKRFESTSFGFRRFCENCGTPLTMQVDHQPETVDFTIATLDDPEPVEPGFHIFRSSRIAWFETADDLPRHDRFRPDTRGLGGAEPPGG
ncbi:MAG TPA: GFA family protein [Allosphingosinicella sp.]|jgi:hypothetical protein|nr:GFA family protein [Allosphingosinicella sp.]